MPQPSAVDLRSDTVTKPSPDMRRAMAEAIVGDDVFMEDPTLNKLQARAAEICDRAHEQGIHVHLDGARVFNAATYLREKVADMTKKFDSVQFCLSKGLGAPVGSMIVGTRDFIERCRPIRKMLGGGMRQVGVLAGAGLVALEEGPKLLPADHENAQILAQGLARIPGIQIDPAKVQTNIVIFDVGQTRFTAAQLVEKLNQRQVLTGAVDGSRIRVVTHRDVSRADCEQAIRVMGEVVGAGY